MSIMRGDRMFIHLKSIGEVNAAGKEIMSFGFKGKLIAEPDKPIQMLVIPLLEEIVSITRYTNDEKMAEDLGFLVRYVGSLEVRAGTKPESQPVKAEEAKV